MREARVIKVRVFFKTGFKRSSAMTSVLRQRDPKPRGFSRDGRGEMPKPSRLMFPAELKRGQWEETILLSGQLLLLQPRAGRRAQFITATEAAKEVPAFVQTRVFECQRGDLSADVSQFYQDTGKRATHRNACSSFPWRGRAGWPSGSSARPLSSSPGVQHRVVIVLCSIKKKRVRLASG